MSSKDVYHRITYTAETAIGNLSNPEIALQLPTSRASGALWELVSATYRYNAGTPNLVRFSLGEATGFVPYGAASVYEGETLARTATYHRLDLAGGSQGINGGRVIVSPNADSKVFLHATFSGGGGANDTDNTFVLKLTFRQLKGSNIAITV